jgi:hypothetical protein
MLHDQFLSRCFLVSRNQIAYLRFIIESYDGVAFLRTLDPRRAVVEIGYSPTRRRDAEALIRSLEEETGLTEIPPPEDYQPL